jgi:hypothetical protein
VIHVQAPSVTVFRADPGHANGVGIMVVPGGGHRMLVWTNEGVLRACALNRFGVTAFVLKYRSAAKRVRPTTSRVTRQLTRAEQFVGFGRTPRTMASIPSVSAGGELVSLVADNLPIAPEAPRDAIDRVSARPDCQVLVYPGPLGTPARATAEASRLVLRIAHDGTVPAAARGGLSAELHMFADTDHGFNVAAHSERAPFQPWPDRLPTGSQTKACSCPAQAAPRRAAGPDPDAIRWRRPARRDHHGEHYAVGKPAH